jgi:hypothetical protein
MAPNKGHAQRPGAWPALIAAAAFTVIALIGALWFIWIPNRRLADIEFMERASPEELRLVAERALESPWGNHHDACLLLSRVGNVDSVPALLHSLNGKQPDGDFVECTELHCWEALQKLTGHDERR